jgi:hypothetical protein
VRQSGFQTRNFFKFPSLVGFELCASAAAFDGWESLWLEVLALNLNKFCQAAKFMTYDLVWNKSWIAKLNLMTNSTTCAYSTT